VMTMSKPGSIAIEVTFQGMSMKQAFDGTTGWMINPFSGKTEPELMNPEMCKAMKSQADIDGSLINYAAKGFTAEFLGEDEFEGTAVYKIKINRADGDYDMFYIDAESYLILMQKTKTTFEGKEMISETVLSDYRTIDGYTTAFVIEQRAEGSTQGSKIEIKEVKINPEVAADYFAFPENK
jgi:outer membrane lipoprotein-sorting protein